MSKKNEKRTVNPDGTTTIEIELSKDDFEKINQWAAAESGRTFNEQVIALIEADCARKGVQ